MLQSKNYHGFVTETLKVWVTNPQGFFDWSIFYLIKFISQPLSLRLLWASRLRLEEKSWGLSTFGVTISWNQFSNSKTFFNWRPLMMISTKLFQMPIQVMFSNNWDNKKRGHIFWSCQDLNIKMSPCQMHFLMLHLSIDMTEVFFKWSYH